MTAVGPFEPDPRVETVVDIVTNSDRGDRVTVTYAVKYADGRRFRAAKHYVVKGEWAGPWPPDVGDRVSVPAGPVVRFLGRPGDAGSANSEAEGGEACRP